MSFSFVFLNDLPFLLRWKDSQKMMCYPDAAGTQLPSTTSLFLNYRTSIQDGYSLIYGPLMIWYTSNYNWKPLIVCICLVLKSNAFSQTIKTDIESRLLLKVITCGRSRVRLLWLEKVCWVADEVEKLVHATSIQIGHILLFKNILENVIKEYFNLSVLMKLLSLCHRSSYPLLDAFI